MWRHLPETFGQNFGHFIFLTITYGSIWGWLQLLHILWILEGIVPTHAFVQFVYSVSPLSSYLLPQYGPKLGRYTVYAFGCTISTAVQKGTGELKNMHFLPYVKHCHRVVQSYVYHLSSQMRFESFYNCQHFQYVYVQVFRFLKL